MLAHTHLGRAASGLLVVAASVATPVAAAHAQPKMMMSHSIANGLPAASRSDGEMTATQLQSMLLKYAARCALREDQELEGPPDDKGRRPRFPGSLGIAPEWMNGTCDRDCQEKVSSCLIALSNRTGKHVQLSLLSSAPAMVKTAKALYASESDRAYPHQEGAFFGNVFSGEAYACRGRDAAKAAQVKRFCATEPESCSGLAEFADAGRCEDVCEMTCSRLSDGTQRCAAAACTDPRGHRWPFPITTYLRNQIEAGNADALKGTRVARDEGVEPLARLGSARYERVDFGAGKGDVKTFTARIAAHQPGARIEVWLDGRKRLGVLAVERTDGSEQEQSALIDASGVSGPHAVVLKLVDATRIAHLSTIEFH